MWYSVAGCQLNSIGFFARYFVFFSELKGVGIQGQNDTSYTLALYFI